METFLVWDILGTSVSTPKTSCSKNGFLRPWPVWLNRLGVGLQSKRSPVQFPVGAHTWVAGRVSSLDTYKRRLLFHQKYCFPEKRIFYTRKKGIGSEWNPAGLCILSNTSCDLPCPSPPGTGAVPALKGICISKWEQLCRGMKSATDLGFYKLCDLDQ